MVSLFFCIAALANGGYQSPSDDIADILDAPRPPSLSTSPDGTWLVELERPSLMPIADRAEPVVKVAGIQLNPNTNGPAREYSYRGMRLRPMGPAGKAETPLELGVEPRVRNLIWHPDSGHFAFTHTTQDGIELWMVDVSDPTPRKLAVGLNATWGSPCRWLPGDQGLLCKVVDPERGPAPVQDPVPIGPRVEENLGRKAPARTYQNLLQTPHDEALFTYYLTSAVHQIGLDGSARQIVAPALVQSASPSPDGSWVLTRTIEPPFSTSLPASRFPTTFAAVELATGTEVTLASLPLADDIPISFGSTRKGRRSMGWRADAPNTLWWVEALDGGDGAVETEERDRVSLAVPPFDSPTTLATTSLRFGGVTWGDADLAMVTEWWQATRMVKVSLVAPGSPEQPARVAWERSYQDRYSDPGDPMMVLGEHGGWVMRRDDRGRVLLSGPGFSAEGRYPFLDAWDPQTGETERLWQAADPWYETVVDMLDDGRLMTRRQSSDQPPNYMVRTPGKRKAMPVTDFEDWAPAFAKVKKEVIHYEREDGLPLSATVYYPPGYDKKRDGPLPAVFWAYPSEFKSRSDAGQVTATTQTFTRPGGSSHLFLLLEGYLIVDDPNIPILGEGDEEPNDTFVDQLVSGAQAAVDAVVSRGIADPDRLVVGGHSYGAFMTANLLAHSDLFRAGIARSGAYNRSLTPWGFQGEQRSYWEARDTYVEMSPFTYAHRIDEPLLMLHGAEDSNSGTYPMQSARMYEAMKGNGATVRWVELPYEEHGYRARESVGHVLWEMTQWCDTYARDADPREQASP